MNVTINKQVASTAGGVLLAFAIVIATVGLSNAAKLPTGDTATVVIEAPAQIAVGQLATLDVSKSQATSFSWKVVPETKNFRVIDNGRQAVFSGTAGEYLFIVAAALGDTVDVKTHKITIGDGGPSPGPDPGPDPDPNPNPDPNPSNELALKVAEWAAAVQSPTPRDDAMKLGQSFQSVASTISAGVLTETSAILAATKNSNQVALGNHSAAWASFMQSLNAELKTLASAGQLPDAEAHAMAWRSIGNGLQNYAESLGAKGKPSKR